MDSEIMINDKIMTGMLLLGFLTISIKHIPVKMNKMATRGFIGTLFGTNFTIGCKPVVQARSANAPTIIMDA